MLSLIKIPRYLKKEHRQHNLSFKNISYNYQNSEDTDPEIKKCQWLMASQTIEEPWQSENKEYQYIKPLFPLKK